MSEMLTPCPFCGGKAYLHIVDADKDPLVRGNGENLIYSAYSVLQCGRHFLL